MNRIKRTKKEILNCYKCAGCSLTGKHSIWCDFILARDGLRIKDNPRVVNGIKKAGD